MEYLERNPHAVQLASRELEMAIIQPTTKYTPIMGKNYAIVVGKLGEFTFTRGRTYWIVEGKLPLNIARELYSDPLGKRDVRVMGHCMSPHPDEWAKIPDKRREELFQHSGFSYQMPEMGTDEWNKWYESGQIFQQLVNNEKANALTDEWTIDTYHIDSLAGLRLFADTLRGHKLT